MATASLTTSPTTIDSGVSDNVSITNTGTVDVTIVRGSQSFTLRPTQTRVIYPEGAAVTAATVSGAGSVSYAATAARLSQVQQFAADPAFTNTYASLNPAVSSYTYNTDGTVATETVAGVTTTYTYNADGTVATSTRAGVTRTYTYNADATLASVA